jgi:hypothetical protein
LPVEETDWRTGPRSTLAVGVGEAVDFFVSRDFQYHHPPPARARITTTAMIFFMKAFLLPYHCTSCFDTAQGE